MTSPRLLRIDPCGPLLAAAAVAVFLLRGFERQLETDAALYSYAGQRFAEGEPPYVGVLNRAGPLAHLVPGVGVLGARLVGADDLLGARVVMMLLSVACVWLTYLVARDTLGSRVAGVVGASTLLTFEGFAVLATGGPREKTTMALLLLVALWAVARRRWLLTGAAVGLATLAWQPVLLVGSTVAVAAALLVPGRRAALAALLRYALGGLATLAATVVAFLAVGALAEFYEGFLAVHLEGYTKQASLLESAGDDPLQLLSGFGWGAPLLVTGTVAAFVLAGTRLRRLDRGSPRDCAVVSLGAGVLSCVAWSLVAFQGWPDAVVLLPFAAVGAGGAGQVLLGVLPRVWRARAAVSVAVVLVTAAGATSWVHREARLPAQRELVHSMLATAGPGTTVQAFGACQVLVLTGRDNPSRYVKFGLGLGRYLDDALPGGLASLANQVEERRPDLLTIGKPGGAGYRWLRPVLRPHYVRLGESPDGTHWFASESLGDHIVSELERVLREPSVTAGAAAVTRSLP
jgi:4-amino-4-deoxy-L-arabinose transferase-like glycosyltransferase